MAGFRQAVSHSIQSVDGGISTGGAGRVPRDCSEMEDFRDDVTLYVSNQFI
ncbi:MAG: hypothetical protein J07HQX50_02264 [Haloquadratum sp. J07HQX50]|nr:MAG: hypothetical protein J07HQX50_02264 [Haloquadratum sp. J07HQX50]